MFIKIVLTQSTNIVLQQVNKTSSSGPAVMEGLTDGKIENRSVIEKSITVFASLPSWEVLLPYELSYSLSLHLSILP